MSVTNKERRFYVYVHRDPQGSIFYVGKGTDDRAWSTHRDEVWQRYVSDRLGGRYTVEIVASDLSEDEALEREDELIAKHGRHLVNWINQGRDFDYAALEQFHRLRDANRCLVNETRLLDQSAPEEAVRRYRQALANLREYESFVTEHGLVADMLKDMPKWGEPGILDRLTMCLVRLGRADEATAEVDAYLRDFPGARSGTVGQRIIKRVSSHAKANRGLNQVVRTVASNPCGPPTPGLPDEAPPPGWETTVEKGVHVVRLCRKHRARHPGCHYTERVGEIVRLKQAGHLEEAARLLEECVVTVERESESHPEASMPPFYHWQLAVVYRKLKRHREECLILERFILHPHASAVQVSEFKLRHARAQQLELRTRS